MDELADVYEQYSAMIRRFLLRLCGNADLAEELTQETFYQAVKQWPRFRGQSGGATWLCAIAKRLYWSSLRGERPLSLEEQAEPSAPDFIERLISRDSMMTAQHILHSLPEPYREVFTLRAFCALSHAQIGELFGKSDQWARVTYYRARKLLADTLKEVDEDGM